MNTTFKGAEIDCIKALAKRYEDNRATWDGSESWKEIGLTDDNFEPVLSLLQLNSVIDRVRHESGSRFGWFVITPIALQFARYFEAEEEKRKEPKDVYETLLFSMKRHPIIGWMFVIVGLISVISVVGHSAVGFLKDLKIIAP